MKVLVIGCGGQLGSDFTTLCKKGGHDVTALDYPQVDITDQKQLLPIVTSCAPQVIVNCAAFTNVDLCETQEHLAFELNASGPRNLALCAQQTDSLLVHFSTDYVFDGLGSRPYTENDQPSPATAYGRSKLQGEKNIADILDNHMIFRIAWLYGNNGSNFVKTIRRAALKNKDLNQPLNVVADQIGTPTWTVDVCKQVLTIMKGDQRGIFHCTSEGECSWYDFAVEILKAASIPVEVKPCTTDQFPRPAQRPPFSVLKNERLQELGKNTMPQWVDGFIKFLQSENRTKGEIAQ